MRPKIVISAPVDPELFTLLAPYAEILVNTSTQPWSREELISQAHDAIGLIVFMTDTIDEDVLINCPSLRIIAGALKGIDNIDVKACTRHNVWCTNVPDLLTEPTADLAVALLLALSRNLLHGDHLVRRGEFKGWRPMLYGMALRDNTVGIIGMGSIGQAIARRLSGFGCRLAYVDERPLSTIDEQDLGLTRHNIDTIATDCDFLILAVPLTRQTAYLVDRKFLSNLKPHCLIINPARGSIVDEEAVADAIENGQLGGYAADVFSFEDLSIRNRPEKIPTRLVADHQHTVLTPHIGSAIESIRREIVTEAALNILDFFEGRRPRGAANSISLMTGPTYES